VLGSALSAAVTSKLCYFLLLCVTCTAYGVLADKIVVLMGPIIFAAIFFKSLVFEALLINHTMEASIGMFDWYSCVDDNLYLGASHFNTRTWTDLSSWESKRSCQLCNNSSWRQVLYLVRL